MSWRAIRIANLFASVAVSVNDQRRSPNRRDSSSPTQAASSVGSIVVAPPRLPRRWATAATVAGGECPAIAPVSPRQKSTYWMPSTSVMRLPCACSACSGNPPGHLAIHVIGTPPSRLLSARSNAASERGWCAV